MGAKALGNQLEAGALPCIAGRQKAFAALKRVTAIGSRIAERNHHGLARARRIVLVLLEAFRQSDRNQGTDQRLLAEAGHALDGLFGKEGQLFVAAGRHVDSVGAPKRHNLAVDVGAGAHIAPFLVDEALPDINKCTTGRFDSRAIIFIEHQIVGIHAAFGDRRQTDPDQRQTLVAHRLGQPVDTLLVFGLPRIAQLRHPAGLCPHLLTVVHADQRHHDNRFGFIDDAPDGRGPVLNIVAHDARQGDGLVDRYQARIFGKHALKAGCKLTGHEIADDENLHRILVLFHGLDGGRSCNGGCLPASGGRAACRCLPLDPVGIRLSCLLLRRALCGSTFAAVALLFQRFSEQQFKQVFPLALGLLRLGLLDTERHRLRQGKPYQGHGEENYEVAANHSLASQVAGLPACVIKR